MTIRLPIFGLIFVWSSLFADDLPRLSDDDTVSVYAQNAREDKDHEITYFEGEFRLTGPDWSLVADSATLYGSLDDPERVVALGSPARIVVRKTSLESDVVGQGNEIEYLRAQDAVRVSGSATITNDGNSMSSEELLYDIAADRIDAGGPEGVKMVLDPKTET